MASTSYRVAGTVPLLEPLVKFPRLMAFLNHFIHDKWRSKDRLAEFVRLHHHQDDDGQSQSQRRRPEYHISILHGEDDYDIPWTHSDQLFWHAVSATEPTGITYEELEKEKSDTRVDLGAGGWMVERRSSRGVITEQILKNGLHDRIMGYPVVSLAIYKAFNHE
ncbi:abhydrolase domain-containing protein 12 [Geosmithia morbida]|uniref:Abhydrolase domain-containing protein 12 n=1 Tax=Geosmithia morbida TaxID=1094350 RepID=A0A9P4YUR6_9HYPO|nr:abhydrolase domain-containing protein 12 [Geosmithia morbida]KAF4123471.1 abhydrolase domain-containing protein 12 [Geosmithia morbida]